MRQFQQLCFDDYVAGTSSVYSAAVLDTLLGRFDRLAVHVVADKVGGTSPRITVMLEHSADSRRWLEKNDIPIVSSVPLTAGTTNSTAGGDESSVASLRYVRLRINLEGTTPRARVRIFVCGRGKPVSEMRVLGESATEFPIPDFQDEAKARPRRSFFAAAPDLGARRRSLRQAPRRAP